MLNHIKIVQSTSDYVITDKENGSHTVSVCVYAVLSVATVSDFDVDIIF